MISVPVYRGFWTRTSSPSSTIISRDLLMPSWDPLVIRTSRFSQCGGWWTRWVNSFRDCTNGGYPWVGMYCRAECSSGPWRVNWEPSFSTTLICSKGNVTSLGMPSAREIDSLGALYCCFAGNFKFVHIEHFSDTLRQIMENMDLRQKIMEELKKRV